MNKRVINILILMLLVAGFSAISNQVAAQVAVIVNKANPVSSMKQIEVKLYYLRKIKQTWPQLNEKILPVSFSGSSPAKAAFHSSILKMTESEATSYFKQRQFSNAEAMPSLFASEADVIKFVSENKGAIGYVSLSAYNGAKDKVKSVFIQ